MSGAVMTDAARIVAARPKAVAAIRAAWVQGIALALGLGAARVGWNLLHPHDLFVDSWVMKNLLASLSLGLPPLPRTGLTLQYPLSYVPFLPFAGASGALWTVRVAYPLVASIAAIPARFLTERGPAPLLGALALLFLPDALLKAQSGTPQGVAAPLFLLAVHFALQGRRGPFLGVGLATLLTHHLTALAVLVLYYAVWILPEAGRRGWLRAQWPCLVFLALWPAYWTRAFCAGGQFYLASMFLALAVTAGLPLAAALAAAAPSLRRLAGRASQAIARADARRRPAGTWVALAAGLGVGAVGLSFLRTPGLPGGLSLSSPVALGYAMLGGVLGWTLVRRGDVRMLGFAGIMLLLSGLIWLLRLQAFFDGVRLFDHALMIGLVASFAPPHVDGGPPAAPVRRADRRRSAAALAAAVVLLGIVRFADAYPRLFTYSDADWAAARWIARHAPEGVTVATDARMSALVTGIGEHDATFEGSAWLFKGTALGGTIAALNREDAFRRRPIGFVLLDGRMLSEGANVGWFAAPLKPPSDLPRRLDRLGRRVYQEGETVVWQLDPVRLSSAGSAPPPFTPPVFARLAAWFAPATGLICR